MKPLHLLAPLLAVVAISLMIAPSRAVRATGGETGAALRPFFLAFSDAGPGPLSAASAGHIDSTQIRRFPDGGWSALPAPDRVAFTGDLGVGFGISVTGAELHDAWAFNSWYPANDPLASPPDFLCTLQIVAPGESVNTTNQIALVALPGCGSPVAQLVGTFSGTCCSGTFGQELFIKGWPAETALGVFHNRVDFVSGAGVPAADVAQNQFKLVYTPAVLVVPGYDEGCAEVSDLSQMITAAIAIPSTRVQCYALEYTKGVTTGAIELARRVRTMRADLNLAAGAEIDLVAHSFGGLVARYYLEHLYGQNDGPIGSLSMLGTPNEGVWLAGIEKYVCKAATRFGLSVGITCYILDWTDAVDTLVDFDLDSTSVEDMAPGSAILDELNDNFTVPVTPVYRVHIGGNSGWLGVFLNKTIFNDCVVSHDSANGPGNVFDEPPDGSGVFYPALSHTNAAGAGLIGCGAQSLLNDPTLAANVANTIVGGAGGGGAGAAVPAPESNPAAQAAVLSAPADGAVSASFSDYVLPSSSKTHAVSVPAGLPSAAFAAYWLDTAPDDPVQPVLSLTLRRPNGLVVAASDPDVISEGGLAGQGVLNVLTRGFVMANPAAGTWEVTVAADASAHADGEPYVGLVMPETSVTLSIDVELPRLTAGTPQVIRAAVFDGSVPVAGGSATATIGLPDGSQQTVTLSDIGVSPDSAVNDGEFAGTFSNTSTCGEYNVRVHAAAATSEGSVTREEFGLFSVAVPGDRVRDHCNADDDADALTDEQELVTLRTDPLDDDTDGDGLSDGTEVNTYLTNPLNPDSDGDGLSDGAEVNTYATNPLSPDTDGDLVSDGPLATAGVSAGPDNCSTVANANQLNTDAANTAANHPGADALGDACDDNISGDGYTNEQHVALGKDPTLYCNIMRADVNGDGGVTLADIILVSGYYNQTVPPAPARYNQTADGKINLSDLVIIAGVYGMQVSSCP